MLYLLKVLFLLYLNQEVWQNILGHGKISNKVEIDIDNTINNTLKLFPEAKSLIKGFFTE